MRSASRTEARPSPLCSMIWGSEGSGAPGSSPVPRMRARSSSASSADAFGSARASLTPMLARTEPDFAMSRLLTDEHAKDTTVAEL